MNDRGGAPPRDRRAQLVFDQVVHVEGLHPTTDVLAQASEVEASCLDTLANFRRGDDGSHCFDAVGGSSVSTAPTSTARSRTFRARVHDGRRALRPLIVCAAALLLTNCDSRAVPQTALFGVDFIHRDGFFDVDPGFFDLRLGHTKQLVLTSDAAFLPATWVTANPGIATVTSTGLVRAFAPGTVVITVTSTTVITRRKTVVVRVF